MKKCTFLFLTMKERVLKHSGFWLLVIMALTAYYGRVNGNYAQAFYFVTLLTPVAVGTAYFFNYLLVPRYLLPKRYRRFALYLVYTVIITVYFEVVVMTISFTVMENFQLGDMNPLTTDPISMAVTIYLIVLVVAFIRLVSFFQKSASEKVALMESFEKEKAKSLVVIADRKQVPIPLNNIAYIESLADYVQIFHDGQKTITREKISSLEKSLPSNFLRIHRSFIVNILQITAFDSESVRVGEVSLPIGRKYRKNIQHL